MPNAKKFQTPMFVFTQIKLVIGRLDTHKYNDLDEI
jgi:hypothetical protein